MGNDSLFEVSLALIANFFELTDYVVLLANLSLLMAPSVFFGSRPGRLRSVPSAWQGPLGPQVFYYILF